MRCYQIWLASMHVLVCGLVVVEQTLLLGITLPGLFPCMPCIIACATVSLFGVYKMSQQGRLMYKSSSHGWTAPTAVAAVCSCKRFSAAEKHWSLEASLR